MRSIGPAQFARALRGRKPVLVQFSAPWCVPCKALTPTVAAVAKEYGKRIRCYKIDADKHEDVAKQFDVRGFPSTILFVGGKDVMRLAGGAGKRDLRKLLEPHLGGAD